eukprot:4796467-Pyramimonas_sp.AAC.1
MKDDFLRNLSREINSNAQDRLLVSEILPQVEASNPTTNPAYSTLLDGEWEVIYSGGVSPGPVPSPTREIALLMYAGGFTPGMFLMSRFATQSWGWALDTVSGHERDRTNTYLTIAQARGAFECRSAYAASSTQVASKMPGEVLRLTNAKVTIDSQTSSATAVSTATLFG